MDAVKLNRNHQDESGVRWPSHSALYRLEQPFYVGNSPYKHCVIADHLNDSVAVATDEHGDPRPEWKVLAKATNTHNHEEILCKMGYTDIYDEQ